MTTATSAAALAVLVLTTLPWVHARFDLACELLSHGYGKLLGYPWRIRSTALGAIALTYTLCLVVVFALWGRRRDWTTGGLLLLSLVGIVAAHLLLMNANNASLAGSNHERAFMSVVSRKGCGLQHGAETISWAYVRRYIYPGSGQMVMAGLLLPVIACIPFAFTSGTRRAQSGSSRGRRFMVCLTALVLGLAWLVSNQGPSTQHGRLLFLTREILTNRPDYTKFGEKSGGMFGVLADFLRASGHDVVESKELSTANLADTDVLIVANPQNMFLPEEENLVRAFLERGGALLGMGDHTGTTGIRLPLNQLFEPYGMCINFDSSVYHRRGWLGDLLESPFDPNMAGLPAIHRFPHTQHLIGATLSVASGSGAEPLLVGRYGYGDTGNYANRAGALGDFTYNEDEVLGDIILAARSTLDSGGRVALFGDTSGFQNNSLALSHEFVNRTIGWLLERPNAMERCRVRIALASLVLLFLALVALRDLQLVNVFLLGVLVSALAGQEVVRFRSRPAMREFSGPVAWIDVSHGARILPRLWHKASAEAITNNVLRARATPIIAEGISYDDLSSRDALIVLGPVQKFAPKEVDAIETFVAKGGLLIATAGFEEYDGIAPLVERFGMRVTPVPLGPTAKGNGPLPVDLREAWALAGDTDCQVLASYLDLPVVMTRRVGTGRVCLIGDTSFWTDRVEERKHHYAPNVEMIREWLLEHFRGSGNKG